MDNVSDPPRKEQASTNSWDGTEAAREDRLERLLHSVNEAAWLTSLSPRTIRDMISTGELEARRIRGRVLIPRHALEKLAA